MKRQSLHAPGQRGFSLVEFMIAMALGLVLLSALVAVFVNVSRTNQEMAKTNSQIENARFAMQLLVEDLVHGGYWGGFIPEFDDLTFDATPTDTPTTIPNPCAAYAAWDTNGDGVLNGSDSYVRGLLGISVQFYSNVPPGCAAVLLNKLANTDMLVVRHADLCIPGAANCDPDVAGMLYFQASRCAVELAAGSYYVLGTGGFNLHARNCVAGPPVTGPLAPRRKFVSHIYYVRDYSVTPGDGIPTLMRSEFGLSGGTLAHQAPVPLVEGIQGLHIEIGIDDVSDSGAAVNNSAAIVWADPDNRDSPTNRGDGVPDQFLHCAGGCTVGQLMNVSSARIYILARADRPSTGYTDTKTYQLGTQTLGPFNDGYKRHVFTNTVRFVNITSRRETP